MKTRITAIMIVLSGIMLFLATASFALTTDELVQLKKAGVTEDIILFMVDANYSDVDRVIKLKGAGYKDETILKIIKSDLKGKTAPDAVSGETKGEAPAPADSAADSAAIKTTARVKIYWYMVYRGETVMQNKEAIKEARISIDGDSIKFEWKQGGLGLLDMFVKEPFKSPFFWDINKDDVLASGEEGYSYMLKSNLDHKGKPDTDGSHYWVVYLDPQDTKVIDYIKERLHE